MLRHKRALKAPVAGQNAGAKARTQATYLAFPRPACSKLKLGIGLPMALDKMTQAASLAAEVLRHRRALKAPVAGQNAGAKAPTQATYLAFPRPACSKLKLGIGLPMALDKMTQTAS